MKKSFFILTACCFIAAQASSYAGFMDSYVKTEVRGGKVTFLPQRQNLGALNDTTSAIINGSDVQRKIAITPSVNGMLDFTITESGKQEMGKYTCKSGVSLEFLSASRKNKRYARYVQTPGEPIRFEVGDLTPAVLEMLKDQDRAATKIANPGGIVLPVNPPVRGVNLLPGEEKIAIPAIPAVENAVNLAELNVSSGEIALSPDGNAGVLPTIKVLSLEERAAILTEGNKDFQIVVADPPKPAEPMPAEESPEENAPAPKVRMYQADSVWELVLILPAEDFKALTEMFATLAKETNLSLWKQKIMETLVETHRKGETLEPEDCGALIAQLADEDYAKRVAADRQLNRMGGHLLVQLLATDWSSLDAEQQFRLQRIRQRLESESEEEDVQIYARVLVTKPQAWKGMLESDVKSQREYAAQRLEELVESEGVKE